MKFTLISYKRVSLIIGGAAWRQTVVNKKKGLIQLLVVYVLSKPRLKSSMFFDHYCMTNIIDIVLQIVLTITSGCYQIHIWCRLGLLYQKPSWF